MTTREKTTAGDMPVRPDVRAALNLPPRERAKMLAESDDSAKLVPAIPPEDLLFCLRAADVEEAAIIISHARPSQISFVLAMEIWDGDEISPPRAKRWLELIGQLGDKTLERMVKGLEITDLAALTGRVARATFADEDGHPERDDTGDLVSFTLDGVHYLTTPSSSSAAMRRIFTLLNFSDRQKYEHLLEILLAGFTVEDEETAAHLRRAALAERGFLETPDAMRIYGRLDASSFETKTKKRRPAKIAGMTGESAPALTLALAEKPGRLREILDRLASGPEDEEIRGQLARLVNLAVSADGMPVTDISSFEAAAHKVYGLLTVGLEALHGANEAAMEEALKDHWLEDIFRVGATEVAKAREEARSLLKKGPAGGYREKLDFLGDASKNAILALARPRPRYFVEDPEGGGEREFSSLAEVRKAAQTVMGAKLVFKLFEEKLGIPAASLETGAGCPGAGALFVTAVLNSTLGKPFKPDPMTPGEALTAMRLFAQKEDVIVERAVELAQHGLPPDGPERALAARFVLDAFTRFRDEAGRMPPGEEPDGRFLTSIAIT